MSKEYRAFAVVGFQFPAFYPITVNGKLETILCGKNYQILVLWNY